MKINRKLALIGLIVFIPGMTMSMDNFNYPAPYNPLNDYILSKYTVGMILGTAGYAASWAPSLILSNVRIKNSALEKQVVDFRFVITKEQRQIFDDLYTPEEITNSPLYLQLSSCLVTLMPINYPAYLATAMCYSCIEWCVALQQAIKLQSIQASNEDLFKRAVEAALNEQAIA